MYEWNCWDQIVLQMWSFEEVVLSGTYYPSFQHEKGLSNSQSYEYVTTLNN